MQREPLKFLETLDQYAEKLQRRAFRKKPQLISEFGYAYATFYRRMIAVTLDAFILVLTIVPLCNLLTQLYVGGVTFAPQAFLEDLERSVTQQERMMAYREHFVESGLMSYWMINTILQALMIFPYCVIFWVKWGATPGKLLTRSVIADARTGGRISLVQAALRYIGYLFSALPLMLGIIAISFDKKRQGWHDKLAGTVVVVNKKIFQETAEASDSVSGPASPGL